MGITFQYQNSKDYSLFLNQCRSSSAAQRIHVINLIGLEIRTSLNKIYIFKEIQNLMNNRIMIDSYNCNKANVYVQYPLNSENNEIIHQ